MTHAANPVAAGLSLLLIFLAAGASFCTAERVYAEEERKPLAAVAVSAEPLVATAVSVQSTAPAQKAVTAEPLTAMPVAAEPLQATPVRQEIARPDSYVNEYLGFTRSDLVSYLVEHADSYLGTPYKEATVAPVPGLNGHMQCEGFIWDVMRAVATQNETDIPCGNIRTEPANGGGWVNWSYYHDVDPITFNTKEEMLASGILEKGDVIWSFDYAGPYGLSNDNHVGFFWGDDPHDDKFWESAVKTGAGCYAGAEDGNRIAGIESMSKYPSVWWVFKLSPDSDYDPQTWAGLPAAGATASEETTEQEDGEEDAAAKAEETETAEAEEAEKTAAEEEKAPELTENDAADPQTDTAASDPVSQEEPIPETAVSEEADQADSQAAAGQPDTAEKIETDAAETADTANAASASNTANTDTVSSSYQSKGTDEMIFYNGVEEDTGYYGNFSAETAAGY